MLPVMERNYKKELGKAKEQYRSATLEKEEEAGGFQNGPTFLSRFLMSLKII